MKEVLSIKMPENACMPPAFLAFLAFPGYLCVY
jgi:hypothetical protein